ncbi:MAG TPA: HYR domain-containing protein [Gemmatimonadaceae bacterium]
MSRVHVASVDVILPDSLKFGSGMDASGNSMVPIGPVANVLAPFSAATTTAAGSCGGTGAAPEYTLSRLESFAPEPAPNTAVFASDLRDDGHFPHDIGFNFTFFGNTYSSVQVYSNGFLVFGAPSVPEPGANGGFIASSSSPNNIIALAWADWSPQLVADGIRFETRGEAPNRKFILQFNNVPEFRSTGRLTSQVVLTEGKNDITIYTNKMATVNSGHIITQGIENAAGTYALYGTFLNTLNMEMARVKNRFQLDSDAVRFTPVSTKDEVAPTFTEPPVNLEHFNDPGLATAVVAVAPPSATDNCSAVTITGVRSDGVPSLDAPYPVGVTTITWTAKDADGNTSTATQTVTVIDNENPVWGPLAESIREVNATSPSGAVVTFDYLVVTDNVGVTSRSCEPASGSVFPLGSTPVTCTASDAAGNSSSQSLTVIVISAHEQIGNLIEYLTALDLPDGTAEPVVNQLRTAYDQTADGSSACKKVSDYLSMLQKKGSNIPSDQISYLTAEGTRIMAAMGCPPVSRSSLFTRGAFGRIP